MASIKTLVLEYMDREGAAHIRELHIEILREKPGTPEHTIRARLSEAVSDDRTEPRTGLSDCRDEQLAVRV